MSMRFTQHMRIVEYVLEHGSITPMEAFRMGITKLSTRVSEMIANGVPFEKEWIKDKDQFGNPVTYMRYSLKVEE